MFSRLRYISVVAFTMAACVFGQVADSKIALIKELAAGEIKGPLELLIQSNKVKTSLDQEHLGMLLVSDKASDDDQRFIQKVNDLRQRLLAFFEAEQKLILANRWRDYEKTLQPVTFPIPYRLPGSSKPSSRSNAEPVSAPSRPIDPKESKAGSEMPKPMPKVPPKAEPESAPSASVSPKPLPPPQPKTPSATPVDPPSSADDAITLASVSQIETILLHKGKEMGILYEARFQPGDAFAWSEHLATNDQALAAKRIGSSRCIRLWNGLDSSSAQAPPGFDSASPLKMLTSGFAQATKDLETASEKARHAFVQIGDSNSWLTAWNSKTRRNESIELGIGITQVTDNLNSKIKEGLSWKTALVGAQRRLGSGRLALGDLYLDIESQISPRLSGPLGFATDSSVEIVICGGSFISTLLDQTSAKKPAAGTINLLISHFADNPTGAAVGKYSNAELAAGAMLLKVVAERCEWTKARPGKDYGVELQRARFAIPLGMGLPKLYNMVPP